MKQYPLKKELKKVSIVIPVFNEEKTIDKILNKIYSIKYPVDCEIIIVNDGSYDSTENKLKKHKNIRLLTNKINMGKGYSLRKAFKVAKGDAIIIQDADLEYNPKDHLKLISLLEEEFVDVVYGSRFKSQKHVPRYTIFYAGNIFLSFLTKILFLQDITDMETCYKAFKIKVLNNLELTENRFGFEPEFTCKLIKKGYSILEIPISYKSRSYKEGKKINLIDGLRAMYLIFKFRLSG